MNGIASNSRPVLRLVVGWLTCLALTHAAAEQGAGDFTPRLGQPGKDVMWLPTPDLMVDSMLRMAEVTARDFVVDLGSGDGKIPITAARRFGARALGLEFNPDLVEVSKLRAIQAGVADKVEFRQADIFTTDYSSASVVTLYLLPEINLRLRPTLLKMKPGTRITSHSFDMGAWRPDETTLIGTGRTMLWVIPALVAGAWTVRYADKKTDAPGAIVIRQRFQDIEGEAALGPARVGLQNARVRGNGINFGVRDSAGQQLQFSGQVMADRIVGQVTQAGRRRSRFEAIRSEAGAPFPEAEATDTEKNDAVRALGDR